MKKKLEAELISIAHKILQLKDHAQLMELMEITRNLYEKLAILEFTERHFSGSQPTIGQVKQVLETTNFEKKSISLATEKISPSKLAINVEVPKKEISLPEEAVSESLVTNSVKPHSASPVTPQKSKETRPEHRIEKINEQVSEDLFVPASTNPSYSEDQYLKNDKRDVGEPDAYNIAHKNTNDRNPKPKSLNDRLKRGIHIGLNDRLAFIKHLFEGNSSEYNKALSHLNALHSKKEVQDFIIFKIKPDHKNWKGKEEYEERFIRIVLNKFDS